jgi:predicted AlkP superfamily phosphohydrolase/phosphomutase/tetratricopeptide (TPR) repeat protein
LTVRRAASSSAALLLLLLASRCGRGSEVAAARGGASSRPGGPPAAGAAAPSSAERVEDSDVATRESRADSTPREGESGKRPPIIWLGLDGLDWELLDRLTAQGRMPNWKRLTAEGYSARLTSFMPVLSPVVWTTIATGVGPDVHRVLDFQEVEPATGQKMPISGNSRAVPAIWNVASAQGRSVGVVGWWATHPAEEIQGFFVTDHASPILFQGLSRAGVAYPGNLAPGVETVVARDGRVPDEDLAQYLDIPQPEITRQRASGGALENPVVALGSILGATRAQQRIARDLYDRNRPDLTVLYLEGTDAIGHVFASFVPPKMTCVSDDDFAKFHRAVDEYYALVDKLLGQWMRRAQEDGATLIVNSDHGFKWGADRPCERSSLNPSTAAFWHRLDGVFAAWGARVRPSTTRGSASVFDMAPTLAALLDLPVDPRETGRPIADAFASLPRVASRKGLFESIAVRRVQAEAMSQKEASEYAARLRSLGYLAGGEPEKLAPAGGDRPGLTEGGWNNLGLYLRETRKDLAGAEAAFQKALALRPGYASPQFNLAVLYREKKDDARALDWLFRSLQAGHADPEGTILRWASEYEEDGRKERALEVLDRGAKAYPASEAVARELGIQRFRAKDCPGALAAVSRFRETAADPNTINAMALFETCLGKRDEALALFDRSLKMNPNQPGVQHSIDLLRKAPASGPKVPPPGP